MILLIISCIHCSTYTHVYDILYWAPQKNKGVLALPSLALGLFFDLYMYMFFGGPLKETSCTQIPSHTQKYQVKSKYQEKQQES